MAHYCKHKFDIKSFWAKHERLREYMDGIFFNTEIMADYYIKPFHFFMLSLK